MRFRNRRLTSAALALVAAAACTLQPAVPVVVASPLHSLGTYKFTTEPFMSAPEAVVRVVQKNALGNGTLRLVVTGACERYRFSMMVHGVRGRPVAVGDYLLTLQRTTTSLARFLSQGEVAENLRELRCASRGR